MDSVSTIVLPGKCQKLALGKTTNQTSRIKIVYCYLKRFPKTSSILFVQNDLEGILWFISDPRTPDLLKRFRLDEPLFWWYQTFLDCNLQLERPMKSLGEHKTMKKITTEMEVIEGERDICGYTTNKSFPFSHVRLNETRQWTSKIKVKKGERNQLNGDYKLAIFPWVTRFLTIERGNEKEGDEEGERNWELLEIKREIEVRRMKKSLLWSWEYLYGNTRLHSVLTKEEESKVTLSQCISE